MSDNGQPTRAAVIDIAPRQALDPPLRRALRRSGGVAAPGSARRLSRRLAPFRDALANLPADRRVLAIDCARDWLILGLICDGLLGLILDADPSRAIPRRATDRLIRLQAAKAARRAELLALLPAADGEDAGILRRLMEGAV